MPAVPAFCDTCGTVFNSGFFVENSRGVTFGGNRSGPCPKCGGMGHVPDGVFNFVGNTIEILSAPERTRAELMRLAEILKEAKERSESKEQVVQRIEKEVPGLAKLAGLLPSNRGELYGFLGVVLAAAQLLSQGERSPTAPVTVNVTQVIEHVMVPPPAARPPSAKAPAMPQSGAKKPSRNQPCICGSGKKYKRCCGASK
jgi:hypothetical protein